MSWQGSHLGKAAGIARTPGVMAVVGWRRRSCLARGAGCACGVRMCGVRMCAGAPGGAHVEVAAARVAAPGRGHARSVLSIHTHTRPGLSTLTHPDSHARLFDLTWTRARLVRIFESFESVIMEYKTCSRPPFSLWRTAGAAPSRRARTVRRVAVVSEGRQARGCWRFSARV